MLSKLYIPLLVVIVLLSSCTVVFVDAQTCYTKKDDEFPVNERYFHHDNSELTIIIENSNHVSHQIINQILKILLEDVACYKKVTIQHCPLYDRQNVTSVLNRVSGRMASKHCQPPIANPSHIPETNVHLEAWLIPEFSVSPWLESSHSRLRKLEPDVVNTLINAGPLGPQGRHGWYVSLSLVEMMWREKHMVGDHWRALQLKRFNKQLSWWGRPELSKFKPDYDKEAYRNRKCVDDKRKNCATLFARFRDGEHSKILRSQIEQLELDVDIVYLGDGLDSFVKQQTDANKYILFFSWRPSALISQGKFIRLSFPITFGEQTDTSDFPINQLTKVTWSALKTGAPEAFYIINNLEFNNLEYDNLTSKINGSTTTIEDVACEWVMGNKHKWRGWLPRSLFEKPKIYLAGLFPLTGKSWSQPGLVEGAYLALHFVNSDKTILPNHTLELEVKDTQCQYDLATSHFISYIQDTKQRTVAGILGPGCSDPAERVASLSKNFHLLMVSYGAEAEALSDRQKYPYFFRTVPPIQRYSHVYPELFSALNWGLVGALAEDGQKLPDYHLTLQDQLQDHGISLIVKRKYLNNSNTSNISQILQELKNQNVRVIIADVFSHLAREIMCEAYIQKMTGQQGYVWFLPAWYPDQWWDVEFYNGQPSHLEQHSAMENVPCTTTQLLSAIEGHFILSKAFTTSPDTKVAGDITVREYKERYALRCGSAQVEESNFASFVYDAVWVFAKGLHSLLQDDHRALKTLHTKDTAEFLKKAMSNVDFMGVSGQIQFEGSDRNVDLIILQFFSNETRVIGQYMPMSKGDKQEQLKLDVSAIRWLSPLGAELYPSITGNDEYCAIELVRHSLNTSCLVAFIVVIIVPIIFVLVFILLCIYFKFRFSSGSDVKSTEYKVTHDRMKELGLLKEEDRLMLMVDEWEVPRKDIVLNRELGEGAFGTVMGGEMYVENDGWVSVAVKTLKSDFKVDEKLEFLTEVSTMKKLKHPNVVELKGVCTREVIYAVMEFMLHGNLKTFLLSRRHLVGQGVKEAEDTMPERLTQMAIDVAQGVEYLHYNKFVHRDLACRNCLVHANKTVKIGDFGMTRHVSDSDIYRFERKGMLPVRWTSPESLKDGIYTAKSDIWSFGVVVFEIVTFGSFPYQGMSNKEVLDYVGRGMHLPLPDKCPRDLQTFIKWCMSYKEEFRPDLTAILTELRLKPSYLAPCLDAPAFSVAHDDNDSLEIPISNTTMGHHPNSVTSMLPFTSSNHSRTRSHSFHDKPVNSTKKNKLNFPSVSGLTSSKTSGRTSIHSKKSPTSSRSSSRGSAVVFSNSMCGIHTCGIGAGWISRPTSGIAVGSGDAGASVNYYSSSYNSNNKFNQGASDQNWNGTSTARTDVHHKQCSDGYLKDSGLGADKNTEEEEDEAGDSGVMVDLLNGKSKKKSGSYADRLEQMAATSWTPPYRGSHRSLSSLGSHGHSPALVGVKGMTGSSGYISQHSRADGKHVFQTVTSL